MEIGSNSTAGAGAFANPLLPNPDRLPAPGAGQDLAIAAAQRANVLVVGMPEGIRSVLDMLWLQLREPILSWHPGQPLELPPPGNAATLILHDVSELPPDDQLRVARWLDWAAGQVRIVSTTALPLWPRVEAGAFNDVLYYRLNTVYLDIAPLQH